MSIDNYTKFVNSVKEELPSLDYEQKFEILMLISESLKNVSKKKRDAAKDRALFEQFSGSIDRLIDGQKEKLEYLDERYGNIN